MAAKPGDPTQFQIACMTLPYGQFPLQRALAGIKTAGYQYVAWGTRHTETPGGPRVPVMPIDAPPAKARQLATRCRDEGLQPLMMFSTVYPEAPDGLTVLTKRVKQAAAAGIPQVLTFGHTGRNADEACSDAPCASRVVNNSHCVAATCLATV